MPSDINVEKLIREAMERGEFDNLKGKGKPLDLDAYFSTPEDIRIAFSLLKSNDFVPEEVELLKEISDLKSRLATADSERIQELTAEIHKKQLRFDLLLHARKRHR